MDQQANKDVSSFITRAVSGDKAALESLLAGVQDLVFNLSLRMLGTIPDAEDASQEIMIKIMTQLATFRGDSAFSTWVFRIAANHLSSYRKSMFAQHPLSFEYYGADIANGKSDDLPDLTGGVDKAVLERELKLSCTNVMLQCLDAESRCIFILGTMFKVDSRVAGEILGLSPAAYRQRLCRIRRKVADFLDEYCGAGGKGSCSCKKRVNYAIASHRLNPEALEYENLEERTGLMDGFIEAMEKIDDLSLIFSTFPAYRATPAARKFLTEFLRSENFAKVSQA